jgi:curved DNA-binding protein
MMGAMTLTEARRLLKVDAGADPAQLSRAFREAAKVAHPDRSGGDDARFREVVEAYQRLKAFAPAAAGPAPCAPGELAIGAKLALMGGDVDHVVEGRTLRVRLPAGLRAGERVRVGGELLKLVVAAEGELKLRGDDLWLSVRVQPRILAEGGRLALDTPQGKRIVWVTRKAGELGLLRLPGEGLPARAGRPQGHLFVTLLAREGADSGARALLRRFAAAWAA